MPRGRKLTPAPHAATVHPHDLAGAEGITNAAVARLVGASVQAVGEERKRYLNGSTQGLHDELRPGRPRTYYDKRVAG